jgi:hypothetical protein
MMTPRVASWSLGLAALALAGSAFAKLPAPSDEAKAKAAEAAAKTAHAGKVDNYKLCLSMDRVAARYLADAKKAGKDVKPTDTPACADPGAFVYPPPAAAAPAAPAATAAAAAPAPKK